VRGTETRRGRRRACGPCEGVVTTPTTRCCGGGKLAVRDVAQLTAQYVVGGGDRTGGYVWRVVEGLRGRDVGGARW